MYFIHEVLMSVYCLPLHIRPPHILNSHPVFDHTHIVRSSLSLKGTDHHYSLVHHGLTPQYPGSQPHLSWLSQLSQSSDRQDSHGLSWLSQLSQGSGFEGFILVILVVSRQWF